MGLACNGYPGSGYRLVRCAIPNGAVNDCLPLDSSSGCYHHGGCENAGDRMRGSEVHEDISLVGEAWRNHFSLSLLATNGKPLRAGDDHLIPRQKLPRCYPLQILEPHQHVPAPRSVRRSQHARQLQLIHDPRSAAVSNLQSPLQQ